MASITESYLNEKKNERQHSVLYPANKFRCVPHRNRSLEELSDFLSEEYKTIPSTEQDVTTFATIPKGLLKTIFISHILKRFRNVHLISHSESNLYLQFFLYHIIGGMLSEGIRSDWLSDFYFDIILENGKLLPCENLKRTKLQLHTEEFHTIRINMLKIIDNVFDFLVESLKKPENFEKKSESERVDQLRGVPHQNLFAEYNTACCSKKSESERSERLRCVPHRNLFAGYNTLCCFEKNSESERIKRLRCGTQRNLFAGYNMLCCFQTFTTKQDI